MFCQTPDQFLEVVLTVPVSYLPALTIFSQSTAHNGRDIIVASDIAGQFAILHILLFMCKCFHDPDNNIYILQTADLAECLKKEVIYVIAMLSTQSFP